MSDEIMGEIEIEDEEIDLDLSLQAFMDDMGGLGRSVNNNDLKKPTFNYGSLEITNYLLWLTLGELKIMNKGV